VRVYGSAGYGGTLFCRECFQHADDFACRKLGGVGALVGPAARASGAGCAGSENRAAAKQPVPPRNIGPGGAARGDSAQQTHEGPLVGVQSKNSFGGIGANGFIPPDPNIPVGKTNGGVGYIVRVVNSQVAAFNKSGALVSGPVSWDSLWSALGATNNAGDGIVQYDAMADRWLVSQLGSAGSAPYSECIAISQTRDPTGAYFLYSYDFGSNLNGYPKFGVWPTATNSAYLATYNLFPNAGNTLLGAQLCALTAPPC